MKYMVEIWEISSYFIEVEADTEDSASTEANRIIQEMTPEAYGCEYGDKWLDVMDAEVKP